MDMVQERKRVLLSELAELVNESQEKRINAPSDLLPQLEKWARKKQEHFIVATLSGSHSVIRIRSITTGLLNRTVVHPREVFAPALKDRAAGIVVAHNHPSGNLDPSPEDRAITIRLAKAGEVMGIQVLDHIIISKRGYYSFLEKGEM